MVGGLPLAECNWRVWTFPERINPLGGFQCGRNVLPVIGPLSYSIRVEIRPHERSQRWLLSARLDVSRDNVQCRPRVWRAIPRLGAPAGAGENAVRNTVEGFAHPGITHLGRRPYSYRRCFSHGRLHNVCDRSLPPRRISMMRVVGSPSRAHPT